MQTAAIPVATSLALAGNPPLRSRWMLLFVLLVGVALHLRIGVDGWDQLMQGRLSDSDSYVRLLRIEALWRAGDWYAHTIPQLNAPEGLPLHWTRPLDVMVLLPAMALHALDGMEMRSAIFWAAVLICPALHCLGLLLAVWAARAYLPLEAALFAGLLLLIQPAALSYSSLGRADHHTLILLCDLAVLGAGLRAMVDPGRHRQAFLAGAWAGLGIWISPEALLVAGPTMAAFGLSWWWRDDAKPLALQGCRMALGMLAVVLLAILAERPPAGWMNGEYDKVSAQHAVLAGLASAVFALASCFGGRWRSGRTLIGCFSSGLAALAWLALYPDALNGSLAAADTATRDLFLPFVSEMQPLRLNSIAETGDTLRLIGTAPAAALALALAGPWLARKAREGALLPLGLVLVTCLAATALHRRFSLDLAAIAAVAGAALPAMAMQCRSSASWTRLLTSVPATALALFLPPIALAMLSGAPIAGQVCQVAELAGWLNRELPRLGTNSDEVPIILSNDVNGSPELAWRTPYRFVGAPYHRIGSAFADTDKLIRTTDQAELHSVLAKRQASFLLLCRFGGIPSLEPKEDSLLAQLLAGAPPPDETRSISLPKALAAQYQMFSVNPNIH